MAIIRKKELSKMNDSALDEKLNDLRFELSKSIVAANKTKSKKRELKRTIARILTLKSINSKLSEVKKK